MYDTLLLYIYVPIIKGIKTRTRKLPVYQTVHDACHNILDVQEAVFYTVLYRLYQQILQSDFQHQYLSKL